MTATPTTTGVRPTFDELMAEADAGWERDNARPLVVPPLPPTPPTPAPSAV